MSDELAAIRERAEEAARWSHRTIISPSNYDGAMFVVGRFRDVATPESILNLLALLDTEREARASAEAAVAAAIEALDALDGIVDDTHPEGDGCPLCGALDELRDALTDRAAAEAHDAAIRREAVEGVPKVDVRLVRESIVDQIGAALSREFAQGSPFEPFDRQYVIRTITAVLDDARKRIRFAAGSDA